MVLGKVVFFSYQNAAMLLLLELVMVQECSFRDLYSQSNLCMMCIRCFPEVHYLPYLLKITFLYLKYLRS